MYRSTRYMLGVAAISLAAHALCSAQQFRKVPMGDFEQWTFRNITESGILGGETKTICNVAPGHVQQGQEQGHT